MKRRAFLATAGAGTGAVVLSGAAPPAKIPGGKTYSASTEAGVRPDWEAPLFHLERQSSTPVVARKIELLQIGKSYFVRATSVDGVSGVTRVKQVEDYMTMLTRLAMPFFAGKDVRQLETLIDQFYIRNYKLAGQALWAPAAYVEQALFDLLGRTVKKPVGELLGGVKRKRIPVYLSGSGRETTAEQEVEVYARGLKETGAAAVKLKIGGRMSRNGDTYPGRTEKMLTLARKTFGDRVVLYVDANGSYNAAKALEVGKLLTELKVAFYEEPCPWEEISETKRVADAMEMPVAFGECDSSFWKFQHMIDIRALDIVQPDLNYNGGFIRSARVARMAAAAGLPITPHNTQTGITACNILQFASAIPNTGPYMEFPHRGVEKAESWYAPNFAIKDGMLEVPAGPGLGVEIDPAYLAKATVIASSGA